MLCAHDYFFFFRFCSFFSSFANCGCPPATAPTHLMGSHSWNHFEHRVTDQNIRDTAGRNSRLRPMEYRMDTSLWAIARHSSACRQDIPNMTDDTKDILLNKEAIAVDQDKAGDRAIVL